MRTLLVENDPTIARGLTQFFRTSGIIADLADTAEEALELVRHYDYDLVVAELTLPEMDGADFVRRLRIGRNAVPVLIMSSNPRPEARIKAFNAGADDVLGKPFDSAELMARMRAIVRRSKGFADPSLTVGPLVLKQDSREVTVHGREVKLTGKEYAILELLVLRKGSVLTKDAFLNHLYGGMDEPEAKIIDVFICKLRKKLNLAAAENLIITIWGRGYMLREQHTGASYTTLPVTEPAILTAA